MGPVLGGERTGPRSSRMIARQGSRVLMSRRTNQRFLIRSALVGVRGGSRCRRLRAAVIGSLSRE